MRIVIAFIVCLVIQQNTANGQTLPELLKNAQSQTDELHSVITAALLKSRMEMSNILTGIVNESLAYILKSLESVQLNNVADDNTDQVSSESEKMGNQISRCSAQADHDIQAAVRQFFVVFNPIHRESLTILNTVLEQIAEWNSTSDSSEIVRRVDSVLQGKSSEFLSNIVPALENELKKFKSVLFLIPPSVQRCVSEALAN